MIKRLFDELAAAERLEYLRGELRAERISQDELLELQTLRPYIAPGDLELLEAAGVPEEEAVADAEDNRLRMMAEAYLRSHLQAITTQAETLRSLVADLDEICHDHHSLFKDSFDHRPFDLGLAVVYADQLVQSLTSTLDDVDEARRNALGPER